MLLSPVFSQYQAEAKLENKLGSFAGTGNPSEDWARHRLQVFLPSDIADSLTRNVPATDPNEIERHGSLRPETELRDGKAFADSRSSTNVERMMPDKESETIPLVPVATYYRPAELDKRPEITRQIEPEFPLTVNPGVHGTVIAKLFIGDDGIVEQVVILFAEPSGFFEDAVTKAFAGARYSPGLRGGKAVRSQLTLAIDFFSEIPH